MGRKPKHTQRPLHTPRTKERIRRELNTESKRRQRAARPMESDTLMQMDGEMPTPGASLPDLGALNLSIRSPAPIVLENKTEEELTAELKTEEEVVAEKYEKKRRADEKRLQKRAEKEARQGVKSSRPVPDGPLTQRTRDNSGRLDKIEQKREEVIKQRELLDEQLETRRKEAADELRQEQAKLREAQEALNRHNG